MLISPVRKLTRNTPPFPLVAGGDEPVFAGACGPAPSPGAEAQGHPDGAFLQAILAGADLAGDPIDPINTVQVGLGSGNEIVRAQPGRGREKASQRQGCKNNAANQTDRIQHSIR